MAQGPSLRLLRPPPQEPPPQNPEGSHTVDALRCWVQLPATTDILRFLTQTTATSQFNEYCRWRFGITKDTINRSGQTELFKQETCTAMVVVLPLRLCCDTETATRSQLPFLLPNSGCTRTAGIRKHEQTFPDKCSLAPRSLLVRSGPRRPRLRAHCPPYVARAQPGQTVQTHHPPAARHGRQQERAGTWRVDTKA